MNQHFENFNQFDQVPLRFPHQQTCLELVNDLVKIIQKSGQAVGFDWGFTQTTFDDQAIPTINVILPLLDGQHSIADIVAATNLPESEVYSFLQDSYTRGALQLVSQDTVAAQTFYCHTVSLMQAKQYNMLKDHCIVTPESTRNQLLGFLIDFYHFAAVLPNHLGLAIARSPNKPVQAALSHYFSDTYWYSSSLLLGLTHLGLTKEAVEASTPSPAMLSLITFISYCADVNLPAYIMCLAVSKAQTIPATLLGCPEGSWEWLKALQPLPEPAISAFEEYDELYCNSSIADTAYLLFSENDWLSTNRQQELTRAIQYYITTAGQTYRQLKDFYAHPPQPLWF